MSADHAEPPSGAECIVCMGDIDADTYQEYKIHDTGPSHISHIIHACLSDYATDRVHFILLYTKCVDMSSYYL